MRFAFTDQQIEFRDAVRQVLAKECTVDELRAAFDAPTARSARWTALAEMGVVGLSVPEDRGGLDLGLVDLVPLLEEAGRVALPEPLLETAALAAPLLAELAGSGHAGAADVGTWLSAIADGRVAAAVAGGVAVAGGAVVGTGGAVVGTGGAGGEVGAGITERGPDPEPVAGADGADLYILAVNGGPEGLELHAVGADRVEVTPVPSLDPTRRLGIPRWEPGPVTRLASGPDALSAIRRTGDRAAVATAAQLLGLSERMITMAAEYAKARQQFGRPIGSFQAVKHLLAGAQVKLEFARPVAYAAAWALDEGEPGGSRAASVAKAYASDAASESARVALQVHGAIGYTWECDLHLFLKRAWALCEAWGSAADHRHRVLASLTEQV